jgi:hypothetical protein
VPSLIAYKARDLILSESIDSAGLELFLSDSSQRAAFMDICSSLYAFEPLANHTDPLDILLGSNTARNLVFNSPAALQALANSPSGTELLVKSSNGVAFFASILRDKAGNRFAYWRDSQKNYNTLKNLVNRVDTKIKRQIFIANGTWTAPGSAVLALSGSIWAGGAGGSGNSGTPANGGNSTFMSITANGGGRPVGGGTTTGGGYKKFTDLDLFDAVFQLYDCSQQGGDGGNSPNYSAFPLMPGGNGGDGFPESGGRGFTANPNIGGTSGGWFGGGGGGGVQNYSGALISPSAPPANSGAGGGAYQFNGSVGPGGGGGEIKSFNLDVTPNSNQSIVIGAGGVGGGSAQAGAAGGCAIHWLEA